jgi:NADH-quinone oxidoreductase subunit J
LSAPQIIFYLIAAWILGSGLLAVTARKIFRSAIWLLSSLLGIAALYFWLAVEFVAAVQIIVYVGGIVVLIIFSIFLTQQSGSELPRVLRSRALFSALAVVFGFAWTYTLIGQHPFSNPAGTPFSPAVAGIGQPNAEYQRIRVCASF